LAAMPPSHTVVPNTDRILPAMITVCIFLYP
jgi:hypothetical protein